MSTLQAYQLADMRDVSTPTSPIIKALGTNPRFTSNSNLFAIQTDEYTVEFRGAFRYDQSGNPISGTIESVTNNDSTCQTTSFVQCSLSLEAITSLSGQLQQELIFEGADSMQGSGLADFLYGYNGSDTISGGAGNDYINAGGGTEADYIYGETGDDYLAGGGGPDQLYGGIGNDEIRAGHGKDTISGEAGSDILYGGGGTNTFLSEADGSIDQLYVMSDFRGHAFDWGRNHGGINADIITEIDANDRITILGTSDSSLTFRSVLAGTYNQSQAGIGIFDGDSLEALYIGTSLNASQLDAITTGDPSRFS